MYIWERVSSGGIRMRVPVNWKIRIFISYRREDSAGYTGRLYDSLVARFGKGSVFVDLAAIHPGEEFDRVSRSAAGSHDVLLAGYNYSTNLSYIEQRSFTGEVHNPKPLIRRTTTSSTTV